MSLPPVVHDRNALRDAIRSSLNSVLLDLGVESQQRSNSVAQQPAHPTTLNHQAQAQAQALALRQHQHQQQLHQPSPALGAFDSPFLPSHQGSLVSQSFGLSLPSLSSLMACGPQNMKQGGLNVGQLSTESILLAAAAACERQKLIEQAKASLLQQHISDGNNNLIKLLLQHGLPQRQEADNNLAKLPPVVVQKQEPDVKAISGEKALEALGNNLRSKTDPYIDVSDISDPDPTDHNLRRTRGGVSEPFPEKVHRMLEEVEKEGNAEIVSFFSHGRAFGVHDMTRFVKEIMPRFFKQSKWNSFARQLNLYGFIRITSGPDAGGYYHELFLKGRPNLCLHMRRVGIPQGEDRRRIRPKNNKNVEPDFYTMKKLT